MRGESRYLASVSWLWLLLIAAAAIVAIVASSAGADTVRIYITNSAGDSVHVVDPVSNKVVQVLQASKARTASTFLPMVPRSISATRPTAR